ncbi:MAG: AAA family ATPase [Candidatus Hydrogenedentes bacterium]|nr:AAA family ATPase [Candidatus Hydrogenedentota bacterium]
MYEAFYGLRERPFNLTPDPKFIYLSEKHKEAFAHLLYGIRNRTGFVMVTGEIGTGKTTICRNLLNQLDTNTELAFIFNPALEPLQLLKKICNEFGLKTSAETVLELVDELNAYLLEQARHGKNCVLLIDEAQNLAPSVLEQIRLLSNLETETSKLLQIILIGQPELAEMLALKELRQLNQRITARYHLRELDERETLQYIAYRLHVAGGRKKVRFNKAAIRTLYRLSRGTPRVINAICDRALLIGYTKEARILTAPIIRRAAHEIWGENILRRKAPWWMPLKSWMPSPAMMAAAALVFFAILYIGRPLQRLAQQGMASRAQQGTQEPLGGATPEAEAAILPGMGPQAHSLPVSSAPSLFPPAEAQPGDPLAALESEKTRKGAAAAILRAWNLAMLTANPADDSVENMIAFAEAHGLATEYLRPALDQLLAINLPALVRIAREDRQWWVALLDYSADTIHTSGNPGETVEWSRQEFNRHFTGDAVIPWRDATPGAPALAPGNKGAQAAAFKETLRSLGRLDPKNTSSSYDAETAAAVAKIQAETGLLVDGIAGRQVRMVLCGWREDPAVPALGQQQAVALAAVPAATPQGSAGVAPPERSGGEASTPPPEKAVPEIVKPAASPPVQTPLPQLGGARSEPADMPKVIQPLELTGVPHQAAPFPAVVETAPPVDTVVPVEGSAETLLLAEPPVNDQGLVTAKPLGPPAVALAE